MLCYTKEYGYNFYGCLGGWQAGIDWDGLPVVSVTGVVRWSISRHCSQLLDGASLCEPCSQVKERCTDIAQAVH